MWICARCGTEAQRPEICSGCGSNMKPFEQADKPKEERYKFVLVVYSKPNVADVIGPFPSVMAGDMWASENLTHNDYEVMLMEAPDNGAPNTGR